MEGFLIGCGCGLVAGIVYAGWRLKSGTAASWWGVVKALGGGPGPFRPPQ